MLSLIIKADGVNMPRTQMQDMQLRNSGQKYLKNLEQLISVVPWIWLKRIVFTIWHMKISTMACNDEHFNAITKLYGYVFLIFKLSWLGVFVLTYIM